VHARESVFASWSWFGALLLASMIVAIRPLMSTFRIALTNNEYTQILLVLPISIVFIYTEWKSVRGLLRSGIRPGIVLLGISVLLAASSQVFAGRLTEDVRLAIQMVALVTFWIASFVVCFGSAASRKLMFPLGFLYWLVPLPSAVLNVVVSYLQEGSAVASRVLFQAAGVPLTQDGLQLTIPGLTVEIAKECSSIRSSLMLLLTTMVLAQVFLRSPARKAIVIALAVPLSVAKNGLRIFTLAMLGTRVDRGYLTGRLHHQGGIVFFAFSLLLIFAALWLLERSERRSSERPALNAVLTS
jgi:exosortase